MARPSLLTPELIERAREYLPTCKDTYRRTTEILEDENQEEIVRDDELATLYADAVRFVRKEGKAAVSSLQRELRLGYGRASRLMDLMEQHKVIGPSDGPAPRSVYPEGDEVELSLPDDGDDRPRRRTLYSGTSRLDVQLPSIAGLAVFLHVSRESIRTWAIGESDLEQQFSGIVDEILAEQENRLVSKGISGEYNPTIAKLLMTKHGYSDKTDITSGDQPIQASKEAQLIAATALDRFLGPKPAYVPPVIVAGPIPGAPSQGATLPPAPVFNNGTPDNSGTSS